MTVLTFRNYCLDDAHTTFDITALPTGHCRHSGLQAHRNPRGLAPFACIHSYGGTRSALAQAKRTQAPHQLTMRQ